MKETWVQDANFTQALSIITNLTEKNAEYIRNTGSRYITGPSKSEDINDVGIYFIDPTAGE